MLIYVDISFLREAAIELAAAVKRFTILTPRNASFGKGTIIEFS